jgi:hypothetical protein
MSKAKSVMSGSFHPWAECVGLDDETPCPLRWQRDQSTATRTEAKRHAEQFPGHSVRVVAEKVDLYRAEAS